MKKFYAMITAALISVSMFAAAPTVNDLTKYQKADHYVACFQAPADARCNDIVWVGTYNEWNLQDEDILVCENLAGFDGWYVVVVPVDAEGKNEGKPVIVNECGERNWEYQCGTVVPVDCPDGLINPNGAECDLKGWPTDKPAIVDVQAWKNGNNPCNKQCAAVNMTFIVYPPFCEDNPELAPTMKGSWNWDAAPVVFEFKGSYFEAVVKVDPSILKFKFNNDPAGSWDNQFEYFVPEDTENDVAAHWAQFHDFEFYNTEDPQNNFFTYANNTLTFDFSDTEKFRYATCGLDDTEYDVTINLKTTTDAPAAGIEVAGNFASEDWSVFEMMTLSEDGVYSATLKAKAANVFKFREAGTWDNEIVYVNKTTDEGGAKGLDDIKFGDKWDENHVINLDLSDPTIYVWKANWVAPEGIENVVLTEKAQKVVVDGVLYIVRDNKMFNVQGGQVR